jgi:Flp pilus assembly protein TadD
VTYAQNGNLRKGVTILALALRLYPEDAPTEFAHASVLELLGETSQAREAYKKTISLEKDFTAAYINLGRIEYESADWSSAIATYRQGLLIDPLSVELNSNLALALTRVGDAAGAKQASDLARKLALTF